MTVCYHDRWFKSWGIQKPSSLDVAGSAIQDMLPVAKEPVLDSLWVCDVFSACEELSAWLGMIAAICFGFVDEYPVARKGKSFDEVLHWMLKMRQFRDGFWNKERCTRE